MGLEKTNGGGATAPLRIFVGVPTIRHASTDAIARFAFGLGEATVRTPWTFDFRVLDGSSGISFPVEFMRNRLVEMFLATKCDALWFVDSDTLPTENSVNLLALDADIVGGVYPIPDGDNSFVWSVYKGGRPAILEAPIMDCDALGTGCMIIRRRVLEDPRMRLEDGTSVFRTVRRTSGECVATDDMDFCQRAKAAGYSILCHTEVQWGHMKALDVRQMVGAMERSFTLGANYGASANAAAARAH